VRGLTPAMGSGGGGGGADEIGCRAPHLPQKGCAADTWFPHWLQKGIRYLIRYARTACSSNLFAPVMLPFSP